MIFVDSNIPMYLVGTSAPHKSNAQRAVEKLLRDGQRLVTGSEVLQEILSRYVAIDCRDAIQLSFDALRGVVDQVLGVDRAVVERGSRWFSNIDSCRLDMRCIFPLWNRMALT